MAPTWGGRYVRTDAYDAEEESNAVLMRTTFGTQKPGGLLANALDIRLKSPANTNVLSVGDRLYALWEAGPPYEIDASTLACKGASDLGGRLRLSTAHGALPGTSGYDVADRALEALGLLTDALSAHPREDSSDPSATIAWSWRQRLVGDPAIEIALHRLAHDGPAASPVLPVRSTLEGVAFAPHDMALSYSYALFVASPTRVDILPFIAGVRGPAQCTIFDTDKTLPASASSQIFLVPRRADGGELSGEQPAVCAPIGAPYHPVHSANAWDVDEPDGGDLRRVTLLVSCWPPEAVRRLARAGSSLLGSWEDLLSGDFSGVPNTNLCRFVVDVSSGSVVEHSILADGCQFDHPKVHPRWAARRSRFVFGTLGRRDNGGDEDATPCPPQSFGVIDADADGGRGALIDSWAAGARRLVDEATLVPMAVGADGVDSSDERAVWLVAPIFDGSAHTSTYVILDGRKLAEGPVCEIALPGEAFIPWALHGCWRDAHDS